MKKIFAVLLALSACAFATVTSAQDTKPYKEGSVVSRSYIKTKPGRFDDYMTFLDTEHRRARPHR